MPSVRLAARRQRARESEAWLSLVSFTCFALDRAPGEEKGEEKEEEGVGVTVLRPGSAARSGSEPFSGRSCPLPPWVAWLHCPFPGTRVAAPLSAGWAALPETRRLPAGA